MKVKFKKRVMPLAVIFALLICLFPSGLVAKAAATGAPGTPSISHDQYAGDVDGNYNIQVSMWYGNNCTSYTLYEKFGSDGEYKPIITESLPDKTPDAQNFNIPITGKTQKGKYYYYIEYKNDFGVSKSNEIFVPVGIVIPTKHKIEIEGVDVEETVTQLTVNQGTSTFQLSNSSNAGSTFSVVSSNRTVVKATIENGTTLKIQALDAGRSGLKITDNKTGLTRNVGVRVKNSNGTLPGMPKYLAMGQVSEDITGDLQFWSEISEDGTNKRCDIRYVYINGGPEKGWRTQNADDPGSRVSTYIKESQKLGMIPYFVFYNIPDDAEDYQRDLNHVNSLSYMEAYYKDLQFFLDLCKEYGDGDPIGIVLEPDFLGYMMQQNGAMPSEIEAKGVEGAYTSGIINKETEPAFDNTITGLVSSINYIINREMPQATFGWQFNTWGFKEEGTPSQGLMHATEYMGWEKGREFIQYGARKTAEYYMNAGILSYGADFISIDKYGLDGGYESSGPSNPAASNWFWNADLWNNYLLYTKTLHETTNKPVTLWQLPVGHINTSQSISPYTNSIFPDLPNTTMKYEDSAPTFFFGDTFKPGSGARFNHFSSNLANDKDVTVNGDTITYGSHIDEAKDCGITTMLFGAGVGISTDAVGAPPSEDYWWISKLQEYYKNPVMLDEVKDSEIAEDVNNDNKVDELDLALIASSYNSKSGDANWVIRADVNKDNIIDVYDLVLVGKKL